MLGSHGRSIIEDLVQESMFGLIKAKTGINSPLQIKYLEFITTYKKKDGITKINSIYLRKKMKTGYEKISDDEIKFSGATSNELIIFLASRGAKQSKDKVSFLEKI